MEEEHVSVKKIIVVRGISNSGKTTSIKTALDVLRNKPSAVITVLKDGTDLIVVVNIDGVIVVVASAGDLEEMLKQLIRLIRDIDWDILVCATKSRGKTVDYIKMWSITLSRTHSCVWIEKQWVPKNQQAAANEATAREILSHIDVG